MNFIRSTLLVPFVLAIMFDSSLAQTPPPCDPDSTEQIGPVTVTATSQTDEFPINLQPCQTVSLLVSTTGDSRFGAGISVEVMSQELTPRRLFKTDWTAYGSTERTLPLDAGQWVPPYRGTRGVEGLPGNAKITITQLSGTVATYSILISKVRRPDYNIGGNSFSNAPTIYGNTSYYGSLHPNEQGQFYKVHLEPNQSIYLTGQAMGSPRTGGGFRVELYDANLVYLKKLVDVAAYGTKFFPAAGTNPTTYTNGATAADFYLKATAVWWPVHDFQFVVGELIAMHLTINAFLPYDNIPDPNPWPIGHCWWWELECRVFEGDGVGRTWNENGSSRTSEIMDIVNQHVAPGDIFFAGPFDWANISVQYEASTSVVGGILTAEARSEWIWDPPLMTKWGIPFNLADGCSGHPVDSRTAQIDCNLTIPNGVYPYWLDPAIEYNLSMKFRFTESTRVDWELWGCRKLFPAYEVWAAHTLIYAGPDSGDPYDIMVPCVSAVLITETGTFTLR